MKDQILPCKDCTQDFVWTAGEQEFYQNKNLKPPVRCPICRATFEAAKKDQFRGQRR